MKVESIDHIHLRVNDLEKAMRVFEELTGSAFRPPRESPDFGVRSTSNLLGLVMLQPTDPSGKVAKTIELQGEGICAISFKVANIEEAISELEAKGIRMVRKFQNGQVREAWFESKNTLGVQIELSEYPGTDVRAAAEGRAK